MEKATTIFKNFKLWRNDYLHPDGTEWNKYSIGIAVEKGDDGRWKYETVNVYLPEGTPKLSNGLLVNLEGWLTRDKSYKTKDGRTVTPLKIKCDKVTVLDESIDEDTGFAEADEAIPF